VEKELPNIVDFRSDSRSIYGGDPYGIEHRECCGTEVFPQQYVYHDEGVLPSHWSEADIDGKTESSLDEDVEAGVLANKHKENLEADQKSLNALEVMKSRT
jgi:hypothetical protein